MAQMQIAGAGGREVEVWLIVHLDAKLARNPELCAGVCSPQHHCGRPLVGTRRQDGRRGIWA